MIYRWIWIMLPLCSPILFAQDQATSQLSGLESVDRSDVKRFINSHCVSCHDQASQKGNLVLEGLVDADMGRHTAVWEGVVRKLTARQMPPRPSVRPDEQAFDRAIAWLETSLDAIAATNPKPGRTETFRRLNRTEYRNTIRDLLGLDVDVTSLLPADESSHGFDNITVADLSPTLLNRYLSAAQKISRLAAGVGGSSREAPITFGDTFRVRPDVTQDEHVEGLPLGTRGGLLIPYHFPRDGEYEIQVHLMRDRNDEIESLKEPHELEVLLDRARVDRFSIKPPPKGESDQNVDANLKSRVKVTAGSHSIGVTFLKKGSSLLEARRQPLNVHFNFYRHPRLGPAIYEVSILGPVASGEGEPARGSRIFARKPTGPEDEESCARQILTDLAHRAYRHPVTDADVTPLLDFYRRGRTEGGFDAGLELALSAILVNPQFLFRIERDPVDLATGSAYRITGTELASRLSYFLWSSMPDEELLQAAVSGQLHEPGILEQQVRRMLRDPRSRSLVANFASQWLYLRNLESVNPDMRLFPDFDDNLRQALKRETELFFESILVEDRRVLDLIKADYTFLNERLAKHYGVPNVYGSRFRRVPVDESNHRGGLLRQGSILTVTSYATRTSPVIRGHWVLQNLVGSPPPPPPPNVPALNDNTVSNRLSIRERLAQHRADAVCASCHQQMDPVGFSLENFDGIGRWRELDEEQAIDSTGLLNEEIEFTGVSGLEDAILKRPELFVRTLTEKLFTFGLGRGVELDDGPALRKIVREARADHYRLSRLIIGIVNSPPFQMRNAP